MRHTGSFRSARGISEPPTVSRSATPSPGSYVHHARWMGMNIAHDNTVFTGFSRLELRPRSTRTRAQSTRPHFDGMCSHTPDRKPTDDVCASNYNARSKGCQRTLARGPQWYIASNMPNIGTKWRLEFFLAAA